MSTAVDAVVFDVDDTLFDYVSACRAGIGAYLAELGLPCGPDAVDRWLDLQDVHYARYLSGEISFTGQRRERAQVMAGQEFTDAEADAWFAGYARHFEAGWALFDDVVHALDALDSVRLGVLSNSDSSYQEEKLRRLGIGDRFGCVLGVDRAGAAKPDPRAFRAAVTALGSEPSRSVYVGDNRDTDAVAAVSAGLLGVWIDRSGSNPGEVPPGVVRITTLAELPSVLGISSHGISAGRGADKASPV